MADDIKVTFIIPIDCRSENECSEEMQMAFVACEQHSGGGLQATWVREDQWKQFEGLTKRDVFVITKFEGALYEKLRATRCLLVGPRCLACSLTEGAPIPSGPEPVFTVAMRGLVVTASGLTKQQKENIKLKVHWMGGIYSTVLTDDTTHLVSDTVLSDKYIKSAEKGIPIMCETWLQAVWEASLQRNISGSSPEFDKHKLPVFANLQVTTSGISKRDKQIIMKLVSENGGVFSGAFQSETTDVVVLNKDGVGSEKYKAALEYGKACVLPAWVKDSAAKGTALPFARYRVAGASTSSPLSAHRLPDMSLNFSRITNVRAPINFVDESRAVDITTMSGKMKLSQDTKKTNDTSMDKELQNVFENFDMSQIKKAGPIFDGFCIWVTGLEGVCRERALAIVSRGGGVRYDCAHERVTHVVASAGLAARAAMELPNVPILNPLWLVRSVQAGKALNEAEFLIETKPSTPAKSGRKQRIEPASPMSKRNLAMLRRPLDLPPPTVEEHEEQQDELVNHYLSQQMPEDKAEPEANVTLKRPDVTRSDVTMKPDATARPDITEDLTEEPTEEIEQIFRGIKIEVQGLDEEAVCELGAEVSAAGGVLAAAGAGGSHALVPLDFDPNELLTEGAEPVTVFWVKDCLSQQELLPIQYYHRPVKLIPGPPPLQGVVASLSTYSGLERAFLDELAKLLGATTQLRFCRRNTANALASTHLICPTATGDKYTGALKWNLPAVRATWLLECAKEGRRVSEKEHLVGETKVPASPQKSTTGPPPTNEQNQIGVDKETASIDKENAMLPPLGPEVPRRASVTTSNEPSPKANHGDDMSPASRYIAMARQGLLGCDSQETPKRINELKDAKQGGGDAVRTPQLEDAFSSPNLAALSPTTRRRLQALRRGEMPSDPIRTPTDPFDRNPETPDSAFGANLRPGSGRLSPDARKRLWRVVHELPPKQPDPVRDKHTPLSEIRNRFLAQFNGDAATPPSEHHSAPRKLHLQEPDETPPAKMPRMSRQDQSPGSAMKIIETNRTEISEPEVNQNAEESKSASIASSSLPPAVDLQLQRLNAALSNRLSSQRAKRTRDSLNVPVPVPDSEPGPESQPNTVGWDDTTPVAQISDPQPVPIKRFMLSSNVDNREEIIEMIEYLGGVVSDHVEVDPAATHLLCAAPGRSEKMLGSVAAGRWVLHPAYVARSRAVGKFLPEEQFEWGNPVASCLPAVSGSEAVLARAACRWRAVRGEGGVGPFHGLVALLHVPAARRKLLARLVEAGGGHAPDDEPPYNNEAISVCFADVKRFPLSSRDAAWLKSRDIPVCAPVLLSAFLTDDPPPVPTEHCLPEFRNT